jgi:outer membrane protein assembly factor BamD (BamD/ComL family)
MVNYREVIEDRKELIKERLRWIIQSLENAIKRMPTSKYNPDRQERIDRLEKELHDLD